MMKKYNYTTILPMSLFINLFSSCGVGNDIDSDVANTPWDESREEKKVSYTMGNFTEGHFPEDLEISLPPNTPVVDNEEGEVGSTPNAPVEDNEEEIGSSPNAPIKNPGSISSSQNIQNSNIDPGCTPIKEQDDPCVWKLWIQTRWGRSQYQIIKNGGNVRALPNNAGWHMHYERGRVGGMVADNGSSQLDQIESKYDVWLVASRLKTLEANGIDPDGSHADAVKYREVKQLAEEANKKYYSALETWLELMTGREPDMVPLIEEATYDPKQRWCPPYTATPE